VCQAAAFNVVNAFPEESTKSHSTSPMPIPTILGFSIPVDLDEVRTDPRAQVSSRPSQIVVRTINSWSAHPRAG
jgi:hypothetical protein